MCHVRHCTSGSVSEFLDCWDILTGQMANTWCFLLKAKESRKEIKNQKEQKERKEYMY